MQIFLHTLNGNTILPDGSEQFRRFLSNPPRTLDTPPEYWFVLHKADVVVAECEVRQVSDHRYEFLYVGVENEFRGHQYSTLLMLNVMDYFYKKTMNPNIEFELWTSKPNRSARKAYRKIFPTEIEVGSYVYFSTDQILLHDPVPWMN